MPRFTLPRLVCACVAAMALVPANADAATYAVRPSRTISASAAWKPVPTGTTLDAALSEAVAQPATPTTARYAAVTGTGSNEDAGVGLPTQALAPGETLSGAKLWVYTDVGPGQQVTASLFGGGFRLGSSTIGPSGPGWHAVSVFTPASWALGSLSVWLRSAGTAGSTAKVYAAYLEIDTNDPPPTAGPPGTPATDTGGFTGATPVTRSPSLPAVQLPGGSVSLSATAATVAIPLACPPTAVQACRGTVSLKLLAILGRAQSRSAARPRRRPAAVRVRAARCARGCRPIVTQSRFALRPGRRARIKIRLSKTIRQALRQRRSVRALLALSVSLPGGRTSTTSQVVTLRPA